MNISDIWQKIALTVLGVLIGGMTWYFSEVNDRLNSLEGRINALRDGQIENKANLRNYFESQGVKWQDLNPPKGG